MENQRRVDGKADIRRAIFSFSGLVAAGLFLLSLALFSDTPQDKEIGALPAAAPTRRCLYVASYEAGYAWQDGIADGIRKTLEGRCELVQFNMDTKRNPDPDFARKRARKAKELIESWKPDVVIASDDNASRYLIKPYFEGSDLPVVFCGINWSVAEYGYPWPNATGMVEVNAVAPLVKQISRIVPVASSAVCLTTDFKPNIVNCMRFQEVYAKRGVVLETVIVEDMAGFEKAYADAQAADFIIFATNYGLKGWDDEKAREIILNHSRKLSVGFYDWMIPHVMFAMTNVAEEQGEYAAQAALRILEGAKPFEIPIVPNRRWNIHANTPLLSRAKITLPEDLLRRSERVRKLPPEKKKCLYVGSYHPGYLWQDGVERGIRSVLEDRCELSYFYMDTKLNPDPDFGKGKAKEARALIASWKPDVVIASDDNAAKYLIAPWYRDADLPFVFCGVNWTVAEYGFPYTNVTGMIETAPILKLLEQVKEVIPDAATAVCLTPERKSQQKNCERIRREYGKRGVDVTIVPCLDMAEFEKAYEAAQEKDFIFLANHVGIQGWDEARAIRLVRKVSRKLTVATGEWLSSYVMLVFSQVPEEQGEYAAQVALRILSGTSPADIPIIANRKWNISVNETLLDRAGIALPGYLLHRAAKAE